MFDERSKERGANKISAIAEQTDDNFPDYSSRFKRGAFMNFINFTSISII